MLRGEFVDDYGNRYRITDSLWLQQPNARYHVLHWNAIERYLIARNDSANPGDPGRWTRIDWMVLAGMRPYTWAFCMSVYDAPTAAVAEASLTADRSVPRTGCNGFPFSRMQPVEP